MTVFMTPKERTEWTQVRCVRIGERFNAECQRIGLDPAQVGVECTVELHKVGTYPRLASGLRANWLAVAASCGLDVQYVLHGTPARERASLTTSGLEVPKWGLADGGNAPRRAFDAALHLGIGQRLNEECGHLALDLTPIEYLCTRDAKALRESPSEAGYIRADFLSLLAERGVDVTYVLAGRRAL